MKGGDCCWLARRVEPNSRALDFGLVQKRRLRIGSCRLGKFSLGAAQANCSSSVWWGAVSQVFTSERDQDAHVDVVVFLMYIPETSNNQNQFRNCPKRSPHPKNRLVFVSRGEQLDVYLRHPVWGCSAFETWSWRRTSDRVARASCKKAYILSSEDSHNDQLWSCTHSTTLCSPKRSPFVKTQEDAPSWKHLNPWTEMVHVKHVCTDLRFEVI